MENATLIATLANSLDSAAAAATGRAANPNSSDYDRVYNRGAGEAYHAAAAMLRGAFMLPVPFTRDGRDEKAVR